MNDDEIDGPWVVYEYDSGPEVVGIFRDEIAALRYAHSRHAGDYVKHIPWGEVGLT